jgi:hypothetical protein
VNFQATFRRGTGGIGSLRTGRECEQREIQNAKQA